ncbi:glycosyltransferase family 4 protein [Hydrogenophaga sp. PBL-H3]|uniref:glycosyltransferase family 4 protein n=1 Tax=Hydrogenophaga sp. PBL-H3 TaxID=434010 RepID=UPI00132025FA|nr:glycosyltransferase family 4 protein [Hydrogenophaga sp. PBL-H3]QHE75924.1 glycosyltransferase family 4 protein [Hydrogenophaga sp. PBL-H3]QHE80348.1 glycosyltransferase family 4 protein [Hydrogenophaga sp. PBL-H3]
MKIALSVPGKFHTFDLARELHAHGMLAGVLTAYPRFKLRAERLPQSSIHTFPWVQAPYMANPFKQHMPRRWVQEWENLSATTFARWTEHALPACDVYVGLSGSSLRAGRLQQARGASYVCDRGSSHIREQDSLLREEHLEWGLPYEGMDPRVIAREEAEYAQADCITVPSRFVFDSFTRRGVAEQRLRLLPYGVNLSRFEPVGAPHPERFDVLFVGGMSLRKGVQYLVQAWQRFKHPAKSLTFVGAPSPEVISRLQGAQLWPGEAQVLGHVPQQDLKRLMSKSHVVVLPSIEEGLAMVMAQAMACGCPVIASENTGARDLFDDGQEGFIVPIRDASALAERLQRLADEPRLRADMSVAALARVQRMGGWHDYGQRAVAIYQELVSRQTRPQSPDACAAPGTALMS